MAKIKQAKDIAGKPIKYGDWCWFWLKGRDRRTKYQFDSMYHRGPKKYISFDVNDANDLSWWDGCELIEGDKDDKVITS